MYQKKTITFIVLLLSLLTALLLAACSSKTPASVSTEPAPTSAAAGDGYPGPGNGSAAYPGSTQPIEGLSPELPNPDRDPVVAVDNNGAVGGILIREYVGSGYIPLKPHELILASIVYNSNGDAAFLSYDEYSLRAETFDTGVFVFQRIPPGEYGLIVNLAVTELPITDETGRELLFTIGEGEALDLGQLVVTINQ